MDSSIETYVESILDYLKSSVVLNPFEVIPVDQSLLESGVLDSYGIMDLITFIEREFGLTIPNEDITREKMGSIRKMASYIGARRRVAA